MVKYAKKKPNKHNQVVLWDIDSFCLPSSSEQELISSMALNVLPSHYRLVQFRIGRLLDANYGQRLRLEERR